MAKKIIPTANQIEQFRQEILDILKLLADDILTETREEDISQCGNQTEIISHVFQCGGYSRGDIITRLAILDEFYSTNLNLRYFGFDEMTDAILSLRTRQAARNYFYHIACGASDSKKLFSKNYGIHKNCEDFGIATSLMSKYAYFELLQDKKNYPLGFPIYDSLAREFCPKVCAKLGIVKKMKENDKGNVEIEDYVDCLNTLRIAIFGDNTKLFKRLQQFDILDAYLWQMGKFYNGNLSILLDRDGHIQFIKNINLFHKHPEDFEKAVKNALKCIANPFIGCKNEKLMISLLNHLRNY